MHEHGATGRDRAAAGPNAWRAAAGRSVDLVTQVKDTAAEALRTHRDPVLVAERRRIAARRRLMAWSLIGLVLTALSVTGVIRIVRGEANAAAVGGIVLLVGLWVYCVIGSTQAARDLHLRTTIVRRLPPPQPARGGVATAIRPVMVRLDKYSDALRQLIGTVATDPRNTDTAVLRPVRDDTLTAADNVEVKLRQQAAELSAMLRVSTSPVNARVEATCAQLQQDIGTGVDEYGRLVAAASEASAAARKLAATSNSDTVGQATERLSALAGGMRELTEPSSYPS